MSASANLAGIILPGPPGISAPVRKSSPRPLLPMAGIPHQHSIVDRLPAYKVGNLNTEETRELVRSLQPDVIVVACFPSRIPGSVVQISPLGGINIHPSLLPENRGPDPLFWAFRRGDGRFGVTIHRLSQRLDAGDIVDQRAFESWHGVSEADAERTLARHGAWMALRAIHDRFVGYPVTSQDADGATYETWPDADEYQIDTSRPAQVAFNFVLGVKQRGIPIRAVIDGEAATIVDADSFHWEMGPIRRADGLASIACNPGTLVVRVGDR